MNNTRFNLFRYLLICSMCFSVFGLIVGCVSAAESKISIQKSPGKQLFLTNLRSLVQKQAIANENHFFVAKYPSSQTYTYMLWREQRALWILELGGKNPDHWRQVIHFPRSGTVINLDKDVVPTKDDVGTSTYLVEQDWVNSVIYDAVLNGDLFVIDKKTDK